VAWSSARVGVGVPDCGCAELIREGAPSSNFSWTTVKAAGHALALGLQAVVIWLLVPLSTVALAVIGALFAVAGVVTARAWSRAGRISHGWDMAYGMATLGNLGMLLGWWADNGFSRVADAGCPCRASMLQEGYRAPWMSIGMLLFANLAMFACARRPQREVPGCRLAMFTGGNVGMTAGMLLGGWTASLVVVDDLVIALFLSFFGMTLGMISGMTLGTWIVQRGIKWSKPTSPAASAMESAGLSMK
jgi:hypothetical protein